MGLIRFLTQLHADERGFGFLDAIPLIGGLFGAGRANSQDQAAAAQGRAMEQQVELMKERQKYGMNRQALLDPLFKELLQRTLVRSRMAPMFGGMQRPAFAAIETPADRLPSLPPPQLIGSEPAASGSPGAAPDQRALFEQFMRERGGNEAGGFI